ncbi:hypothetical protein STTU_1475 [Streptomyces sp. Tu6071]|uniref:hypothetical protein n=1 Tax=Streptomyces sp. Tu6071 TaxID=355249 RepID=UPI00020E5B32|nr:hypothetical protein [Streptomyces sp. Tu6071]EGJ74264.1 hypothetical protein STTU_1475 [Streptomyces sp. Tu6071]
MNGSTPPWKRRRTASSDGPERRARANERGRAASLDEQDAQDAAAALLPAQQPPTGAEEPGTTLGRDTAAARGDKPPRGGRLTTLRSGVGQGLRRGRDSARAAVGFLADRIIETAPRVPVRDLATLRRQFPGLGPEELADKLVNGAARSASAVGASIGAAAMMPVPPALPAELAAEITAVAAIELKLVAELHEVYGHRPPGTRAQRSSAYLTAWTQERGVDLSKPLSLTAGGLSGQAARELRQQIMKRTIRNLPNLVPFLIGAAVGAYMNRRDTRKLAEHVRADLRKRAIAWERLEGLPALEAPEEPYPGLPGPRRDADS